MKIPGRELFNRATKGDIAMFLAGVLFCGAGDYVALDGQNTYNNGVMAAGDTIFAGGAVIAIYTAHEVFTRSKNARQERAETTVDSDQTSTIDELLDGDCEDETVVFNYDELFSKQYLDDFARAHERNGKVISSSTEPPQDLR